MKINKIASTPQTQRTVNDFKKFANEYMQSLKPVQTKLPTPESPVLKTYLATTLYRYKDLFAQKGSNLQMNNISKRFAETLVSGKHIDLASIVYSFLIKMNPGNVSLIEQAAVNALKNAERLKDPVHIMARAYDLKHVYRETSASKTTYMKILNTLHRELTKITKDYDKVQTQHVTISTGLQPVQFYELKLAEIKFELALNLKDSEPRQAVKYLNESIGLFDDNNLEKGKCYNSAKALLFKIQRGLKHPNKGKPKLNELG